MHIVNQLIVDCFLARARTIRSVIALVLKMLLLVFLTIFQKIRLENILDKIPHLSVKPGLHLTYIHRLKVE